MELQQQRTIAAATLVTAGVLSGIGGAGGFGLNFNPQTQYCLPKTQCHRTDLVDSRVFTSFQEQAAKRAEELAQRREEQAKKHKGRYRYQELREDAQENWENFAYGAGLTAEKAKNIFSSASTKRFLDNTAEARYRGWSLTVFQRQDGHATLRRLLAGVSGVSFFGALWLLTLLEDSQPALDLEASLDLEFHEKQYREQKQGAFSLFAEGLAWNLAEAELVLKQTFTGMTRRQLARLEAQIENPRLAAGETDEGSHHPQPALPGQSLDDITSPRNKVTSPSQEPQKQLGQEDAKKKLWKLIERHEGGWIKQILQRPLLIYGDMGSYKSYFAAFLALCRHYLLEHEIISITDPDFHQNCTHSWKYLVELGVEGLGAHDDYYGVGQGIRSFYDRCSKRTEDDPWITSIFDEVTTYGDNDGSKKPASGFLKNVLTAPRKSHEAPILIGHDDTLSALGGAEGVSGARNRGLIRLMLVSKTKGIDYEPLFRGFISGLKDDDGKSLDEQPVSISQDWIRPEYVYGLFNSPEPPEADQTTVPVILQPLPDSQTVLCLACMTENPVKNRYCHACGCDLHPVFEEKNSDEGEDLWLRAIHHLEQSWKNPPDRGTDSPADKENLSGGQGEPPPLSGEDPDSREGLSTSQDKVSGFPWTVRLVQELFPDTTPDALFQSVSASARTGKKVRDMIKENLKCREGKDHPTRSYTQHGKSLLYWLITNYDDGSLASLPQIKEFLTRTEGAEET